MATNFKTLYDRYEYHLHELSHLTKSGWFVDVHTQNEHMEFDDPEKRKEYNSHLSEMKILIDRIEKEFPQEYAEYLASEEAARVAENKTFFDDLEAKQSKYKKRLLDEIRAFEEKYP